MILLTQESIRRFEEIMKETGNLISSQSREGSPIPEAGHFVDIRISEMAEKYSVREEDVFSIIQEWEFTKYFMGTRIGGKC